MHPGRDIDGQLRLFFALWPEERLLAAMGRIANDVAQERQGRASREENLHVTMAFIGEVHSIRLPRLEALGDEVARDSSPFELTFGRLGGNAHGIAWLAPDGASGALQTLHDRLAERLESSGFPIERRAFRPHVTLARDCSRPVRPRETTAVIWPVTRLSLIASTLAPGGARYTELSGWPLGGGREKPR